MPSLERLVEDCQQASHGGRAAVLEVVARWLTTPRALGEVLVEPAAPGIRSLHRSPMLTVLDFCWAPSMTLPPHDHRMEAVIGIVDGREDNLIWRERDGRLYCVGGRSLGRGEVIAFSRKAVHSVTNPLDRGSRALHVYLGDFFAPPQPRREWNGETLEEGLWDAERTRARFARRAQR